MEFRILEITGLPDYGDYDGEYVELLKRHADDLSNCVKTIFSYAEKNVVAKFEILLMSTSDREYIQPHIFIILYSTEGCTDGLFDFVKISLSAMNYEFCEHKQRVPLDDYLATACWRSIVVLNGTDRISVSNEVLQQLLPAVVQYKDCGISMMYSLDKPKSEICFDALFMAPDKAVGAHLMRVFYSTLCLCSPPTENLIQGSFRNYCNMRLYCSNKAHKTYIDDETLKKLIALPKGIGYDIRTVAQPQKLPLLPKEMLNGADGVPIGTICGHGQSLLRSPLHEKTSHLSVLGMSGSGKSTFLLNLLHGVWQKHEIPFLVVDPISTEYRQLTHVIDGLQLFTPGNDSISPFMFNPFALPTENITVQSYKSILNDLLCNSMQLVSPLNLFLSQAIDYAYRKFRWLDDSTKTRNPGITFNLSDFIVCFEQVFNGLNYVGESRNMLSAAKVRLNSLLPYFDTYAEIPLDRICSRPTVVELGYMQQPEVKSTVLIYLLKLVRLYVEEQTVLKPMDDNRTRLLFVMDEAHCILNALESGENMNNAQKSVIGMIKNMLDEVRKYGLSMVFADQTASVLLSIMAKTHTQIVMNLQLGNKDVGEIIGLEKHEKLRKLQPGEAFVKDTRVSTPIQVKTPPRLSRLKDVSDAEATRMMSGFWTEYAHLRKPYPICRCCPCIVCDSHIRTVGRNGYYRIKDKNDVCLKNLYEETGKNGFELIDKYIGKENCSEPKLLMKYRYCCWAHIKRDLGDLKYRDETVFYAIGNKPLRNELQKIGDGIIERANSGQNVEIITLVEDLKKQWAGSADVSTKTLADVSTMALAEFLRNYVKIIKGYGGCVEIMSKIINK